MARKVITILNTILLVSKKTDRSDDKNVDKNNI